MNEGMEKIAEYERGQRVRLTSQNLMCRLITRTKKISILQVQLDLKSKNKKITLLLDVQSGCKIKITFHRPNG